jgi:hypothetical protein
MRWSSTSEPAEQESHMKTLIRLVLVAVALPLATGCGGDDNNNTGNGGPDLSVPPADLAMKAAAPATISISVPATFTGTATQLIVAAFDSFPVAGPPAGVLYQAPNPTVTAGQTLMVTGDAGALTGDKYVLAVLYMQGGGTLSPKPGVDYASAGSKVTFTGKAVTVGPLVLAKIPGGDGGI